ncbi:MAG TPA: hypothetical protein VGS22_00480 [Thermoanaerobaculia bacterium]|nr:hypothetical protein [Thermoanaerobaculia bacterium]
MARLIDEQKADPSKKIILFLNDHPIRALDDDPPTAPEQNVLRFPLRRTEDSRQAWASILGKPPLWGTRRVKVSVGIGYAIPSGTYVQLQVLPAKWFAFWLFLFAVLVFGFRQLAKSSNLLRDDVPTVVMGERPSYSLSRCQAAWWFFIVLASYLFIGLVTGDYSTSITGTVLVLLGISAGTTLASAVVDSNKDTPTERKIQEDAAQSLSKEATNLAASNKSSVEKTEEWSLMQSQLRKLRNQSETFWTDILSDANGVNLHRFQMAAWTFILGIIFVIEVFRELAMPQFNETLLGLMGISAGTFLSLKTTEPTVPTVSKPDPSAAPPNGNANTPPEPDPKE